MNNGYGHKNPTPPLDEGSGMSKNDKKLMKAAKERVETRGFLKWMLGLGVLISIAKIVLWFIAGGGETFWPMYFIASWGLMMVILCIIFVPSLLNNNRNKNDAKIMAEYEKLKKRNNNS